jgi:hypothetical protein
MTGEVSQEVILLARSGGIAAGLAMVWRLLDAEVDCQDDFQWMFRRFWDLNTCCSVVAYYCSRSVSVVK